MEKRINVGKVLTKNITKIGLKKFAVAKALNITRPTLNQRLLDGEFTEKQMEILKKNNWI